MADRVDGLPGDQHGHDHGLPGPCSQLERQTGQIGIGLVIGLGQAFQELLSCLAKTGCNLSEPYGGFDCFNLAEKGTNTAEWVVSPVLE